MNGLERLAETAARHNWSENRRATSVDDTTSWTRGDQWISTRHTMSGRVTTATRSWGRITTAHHSGVADRVIVWMTEPQPGEDRPRRRIHEHAERNGWVYGGFSGSGRTYTRDTRRITIVCTNAGGLTYVQRNFGEPGEGREFHTNIVEDILPWFESSPGPKPAESPAPAPIRSAIPNTPDLKLRRLLEELDRATALLRTDVSEMERARQPRPDGGGGTTWAYSVDALEIIESRLGRLAADAQHAVQEAQYLLIERHPSGGKDLADRIRELQAERGRD